MLLGCQHYDVGLTLLDYYIDGMRLCFYRYMEWSKSNANSYARVTQPSHNCHANAHALVETPNWNSIDSIRKRQRHANRNAYMLKGTWLYNVVPLRYFPAGTRHSHIMWGIKYLCKYYSLCNYPATTHLWCSRLTIACIWSRCTLR